MTAHGLAELLQSLPDIPVIMNGWGSDEGVDVQVTGAHVIDVGGRIEIHLEHEEVKW